MRRFHLLFAAAVALICAASCDPDKNKIDPDDEQGRDQTPEVSGEKLSGITYQLNVYSFADSNGDGWGDLNGITQHLDYLDALGATALWLSPIQTSDSYHGYNVLDYNSIDPKLGTEADFKNLIDKAGEKGIDIYMDYVLNHSGRGEWFQSAISSERSPYRSFYVLSESWADDVAAGKVDNYAGAKSPGMGTWYTANGGDIGYKGRLHFKLDWNKKTITVTETTAAAQSPNTSANKWLWIGSAGLVGLYETSTGIHEITIDVDTDWGFLVRSSSTSWDNGTKWGGSGKSITFGEPYNINSNTAADITFGGSSIWYFASFDKSMPDLNYGPYGSAAQSEAFKALAASADKWINLGVNGLRLDAVIWIYQDQVNANIAFLQEWYKHCNTTYKARGGKGEMFMVGEAWKNSAQETAPYFRGLPSNFDFPYWWTLKDCINNGKGNNFAKYIIEFRNLYKAQNPDFIDAIKLSNHDEDRAGNDFGRSTAKEKLAGAVLLTSPGKPFIYQGEELGYWGNKSGGDEYVRAPIKWTRTGSVPAKALGNKVDNNMLSAEISVEAQAESDASVLSVYRAFAKARNSYKALAKGEIAEISCSNGAGAAWTMSYDGQTALVVHNFGNSVLSLPLSSYSFENRIVSNGSVSVNGINLILGPYASAVYIQ